MMAFSGVRSSWDMFARNCDLCWLATSSCAARLLDLLEEAGVLDRQDGLAGERLEEIDDGLGERARRLAADHQRTDDTLLADQRDGQQGAEPGPQQCLEHRTRGEVAGRRDVRHLLGDAKQRGPPDDMVIGEMQAVLLDQREQLGRHPVGCPRREGGRLVVQLVDRAGVGTREPDGVRDDRGQHLLEVERGRDGLADLAQGRQFLTERANSWVLSWISWNSRAFSMAMTA